jgi:hypothetical protein
VATPEAALALANRLAASVADDDRDGGPGGGRYHWGVVHTTVRVAPGVLLRRADTAAYQAAVNGEAVALAES